MRNTNQLLSLTGLATLLTICAEPGLGEALDCTASPFGQKIEVGGRYEMLITAPQFNKAQPGSRVLSSHMLRHDRRDFVGDLVELGGPSNGYLSGWDGGSSAGAKPPSELWASTATDVDGDGKGELIVAFTGQLPTPDGSYLKDVYQLWVVRNQRVRDENGMMADGYREQLWSSTLTGHSAFQAAHGDFDGDKTTGKRIDEVAVVTKHPDGTLNVFVWKGARKGIAQKNDQTFARFHDAAGPQIDGPVRMAMGDVSGNGKAEVVAIYIDKALGVPRLKILGHDPSGDGAMQSLLDVTLSERPKRLESMRLGVADVIGDPTREIIFVSDDNTGDGMSIGQQLTVYSAKPLGDRIDSVPSTSEYYDYYPPEPASVALPALTEGRHTLAIGAWVGGSASERATRELRLRDVAIKDKSGVDILSNTSGQSFVTRKAFEPDLFRGTASSTAEEETSEEGWSSLMLTREPDETAGSAGWTVDFYVTEENAGQPGKLYLTFDYRVQQEGDLNNVESATDLMVTVDGQPLGEEVLRVEMAKRFRARAQVLDAAFGDVDADAKDEIVIATLDERTVTLQVYDVAAVGPEKPRELVTGPAWSKPEGEMFKATGTRIKSRQLSLAIADMDGDARREVLAVIPYYVYGFSVAADGDGRRELALIRFVEHGALDRGAHLAMGDWSGNSTFAEVSPIPGSSGLTCKTVRESSIESITYSPPYWERWQLDLLRRAWAGKQQVAGTETSSNVTGTASHSVSGYIGAGLDAGPVTAMIKATAGYEWGTAETEGTTSSVETSATEGVSVSNSEALVQFREQTYDCFHYGVKDDATGARARVCTLRDAVHRHSGAEQWATRRDDPEMAAEWLPVRHAWGNLARRGNAYTAADAQTADALLDGDVLGDMVEVAAGDWWEVDLGRMERVDLIRVWGEGVDGDMSIAVVDYPLGNVPVGALSVGDDGLRYLSTQDARINRVRTVLTGQPGQAPVRGRFIRISRATGAALKLSEVEVFGGPHIDPDAYPVDVRKNPDKPEQLIDVRMSKDSAWVPIRGKLIWKCEGVDCPIGRVISAGDGDWSASMSSVKGSATVQGDSASYDTSIGVELELTALVVALGGGYEYTTGLVEDWNQTLSWSSSLEMGGQVAQLPNEPEDSLRDCFYMAKPFLYEVTDYSDAGFRHTYLAYDYFVPEDPLKRDLTREVCQSPRVEGSVSPAQ
ncbi:MAG: hypothetical protein AAF184_24310 [Pseudomonadota bacterium]